MTRATWASGSEPRAGGVHGLCAAFARAGRPLSPDRALRLAQVYAAASGEPDEVVANACAAALGTSSGEVERLRMVVLAWAGGTPAIPEKTWWAKWKRVVVTAVVAVVLGLGLCAAREARVHSIDQDGDGYTAMEPVPPPMDEATLALWQAGKLGWAPLVTLLDPGLPQPEVPAALRRILGDRASGWLAEALPLLPVGDCAPDDPAISVAAMELCNGIDDNCDGLVDTYAVDAARSDKDGDSFVSSGWSCAPDRGDVEPAPERAVDFCDEEPRIGGVPVQVGEDRDGDGVPGTLVHEAPTISPTGDADCTLHTNELVFSGPEDWDDNNASIQLPPLQCPDRVAPDPVVQPQLALPGLLVGVGLLVLAPIVAWLLARQAESSRRRRREKHPPKIESLPGPFTFDLPAPRLPLIRPALVRAAHARLTGEPELSSRLDVLATVTATARQAGIPAPRWQALPAGAALDLWIDTSRAAAPWRDRMHALATELSRLGARVSVRTFDAAGRLAPGVDHPGRVLLVVGPGPDAPEVSEVVQEFHRRTRRVWLHPDPNPAAWPTGLRDESVFLLTGEGLVAAMGHLRREPRGGLRVARGLVERDRSRLLWLADHVPFASPLTTAALLRLLDPETPEALLLAAPEWLARKGSLDWPDRVTAAEKFLDAIADWLVVRGGSTFAKIHAAIRDAEPPRGSAAHVIWQREEALFALRTGDPDAIPRLEALDRSGFASALGLTRDRAGRFEVPQDLAKRWARLGQHWQVDNGVRAVRPWAALAVFLASLAAGGASVGYSWLHPVEMKESKGAELTLVPGGGVSWAEESASATLWSTDRTSRPMTKAGTSWTGTSSEGSCVQATATVDGAVMVSGVLAMPPAGVVTLVVAPFEEPPGLETWIWTRCGPEWRTTRVRSTGTQFSACASPRVRWVRRSADEVSWFPETTADATRMLRPPDLGVPLSVSGPSAVVNLDAIGEGLPTLIATTAASPGSYPFVLRAEVPLPLGTWVLQNSQHTLCSKPFDVSQAGTAAMVEWGTCGPGDPQPVPITVLAPAEVPAHEVFVRAPTGGSYSWLGDSLQLKAPASGSWEYSIELGGPPRLWTAKPKPESYYDKTVKLTVTADSGPLTADLRGPPTRGFVHLMVTDRSPLSSVLSLKDTTSGAGKHALREGLNGVASRHDIWVASEDPLVLVAPDGTRTKVAVKLGAETEHTLARGTPPRTGIGKGTVLDFISSAPVAGANVRCQGLAETRTNTQGEFQVRGAAGGDPAYVACDVSASGYDDVHEVAVRLVTTGTEPDYLMEAPILMRKATVALEFTVQNVHIGACSRVDAECEFTLEFADGEKRPGPGGSSGSTTKLCTVTGKPGPKADCDGLRGPAGRLSEITASEDNVGEPPGRAPLSCAPARFKAGLSRPTPVRCIRTGQANAVLDEITFDLVPEAGAAPGPAPQ